MEHGQKLTYEKGHFFIVSKGFTGRWKTIGKSGDFLEVAIYAKTRSKKKVESLPPHQISKLVLSGLDDEKTDDKVYDGSELTVQIHTAQKGSSSLIDQKKDHYNYILNGMVILTSEEGTEHVFHSGEFYSLPKGFKGRVSYDGFDIYRELVVSSKQ